MRALLLFLSLWLAACVPSGVVLQDMRHVQGDEWRRDDHMTFVLDSAAEGHQLWVMARVNGRFYYDTLWLKVGRDTIGIPATAMRGKSLRQGEWRVGRAHSGKLTIMHLMHSNPLPGVTEVGVKVE